jgi:fatty acid desaturase
MSGLFRRADAWPNILMIAYTLGGWMLGVWLLMRPGILLNAAGVLLTAHSLVCSGYMIHECAHQTVFARAAANDRLGMLMGWLNGACVANYQRLKVKHLRHHADRLDVVTFDYRAALRSAPAWVRRTVLWLEWAYIPVVELLMRGMVVVAPFRYGTVRDRVRTTGLAVIRLALWIALALISVKALLLYAVSYLIFIQVLRFMDAFQHTYEVFPSRSLTAAPADPRRTRQYEHDNTYSNLLATRWPLLNLLVLNFPYHNAHHARTGVPWYELPALHRRLFGEQDAQVIPCRALIASYHRHRVERVLRQDYGSVAAQGERASGFVGAVGVSFLTAV